MSTHQARLLASAILLVFLGAAPLAAQTKPKVLETGVARPASAIFIGNSFFYYNNSLHNHVLRLLRAGEPDYKFRGTSVTISGSGSGWHDVESYFRPNALGTYSFDADNNVVFNKIDKLFDLAIMMDCSQCPNSSAAQAGVPGVQQKARRHCAQARCQAGVLHVVGLCRQAGDDR